MRARKDSLATQIIGDVTKTVNVPDSAKDLTVHWVDLLKIGGPTQKAPKIWWGHIANQVVSPEKKAYSVWHEDCSVYQ